MTVPQRCRGRCGPGRAGAGRRPLLASAAPFPGFLRLLLLPLRRRRRRYPSPGRWLPLLLPPPLGAASRAEAAAEHEPRRPSRPPQAPGRLGRRPPCPPARASVLPPPRARPGADARRRRAPPSARAAGGPQPSVPAAPRPVPRRRPRRPAAPPGPARHARPGRGQSGPGLRRGEQPEEPRVLGLRSPRPELGVKPSSAAPSREPHPTGRSASGLAGRPGSGRTCPRPPLPARPPAQQPVGRNVGSGVGEVLVPHTLGFLWDGKFMAVLLSC